MLLVDHQIRGLCVAFGKAKENALIEPYAFSTSGKGIISYGETSAGYDLRLAPEIWVYKNTHGMVVDPKKMKDSDYLDKIFDKVIIPEEGFILSAHSYVLGRTYEYLRFPSHLKGRCVGKSTLARSGILINTTPAEPEWKGHLTLEIGNILPCSVRLYAMEGIAQMEFECLNSLPAITYASKGGIYQGQTGVTPSRTRE